MKLWPLLMLLTCAVPRHAPIATPKEVTCHELEAATTDCITGCEEFENIAACIWDLCMPLTCEARAQGCPITLDSRPPSPVPTPSRPFTY